MKHTKKILTVLMIAMMLCTLFATNAFAVTDVQQAEAVTGFDITKNLTVPEGAAVPKETFNFSVTPDNTVTEGYNEDLKVNVYKGIALGDEATKTIASDSLTGQGATVSGKAVVDLTQTTFTKPGAYVYTVKETKGNTPGMTYSEKEYKVYVYVGTDKNVIAVKAYEKGNTAEKAPIVFDNTFVTKALTVTKTVEGNMGDTEKKFDFTLDVTGCDQLPEGSTIAAKINRNGSTENATVTVGTQFIFQLAHGDSLVVSNLPVGVKYTVAEKDYSQEGYTTTIDGIEGLSKSAAIEDADATVAVVNTNGTTIDTGVMLDFAPYVLIFIVAVGAAVMFIRKRKTSTEE